MTTITTTTRTIIIIITTTTAIITTMITIVIIIITTTAIIITTTTIPILIIIITTTTLIIRRRTIIITTALIIVLITTNNNNKNNNISSNNNYNNSNKQDYILRGYLHWQFQSALKSSTHKHGTKLDTQQHTVSYMHKQTIDYINSTTRRVNKVALWAFLFVLKIWIFKFELNLQNKTNRFVKACVFGDEVGNWDQAFDPEKKGSIFLRRWLCRTVKAVILL